MRRESLVQYGVNSSMRGEDDVFERVQQIEAAITYQKQQSNINNTKDSLITSRF